MHRARWFIAVGLALPGLLAASSASARIEIVTWSHVMPCSVDGFELRYGFSAGALDEIIDVGRPRQAGRQFSYELDVPDNQELHVCVAAVRGEEMSACSAPLSIAPATEDDLVSEPAPEGVQRSWCEDFLSGDRQSAWLDTGADSSLSPASGAFEVSEIDDDFRLVTRSNEADIHSHFRGTDGSGTPAAQWNRYEYSGSMMFGAPGAGVGVTIYSRYNLAEGYYRLGRHPLSGTFELERDHVDPSYKCTTGGIPTYVGANSWYTFRLQAEDTGLHTTLRAKIWRSDQSEPEAFQWLCTDTDPNRQLSGAIGVWSTGLGERAWDDLHVAALEDPSASDPLGTPGKPELSP